MQKQIIVLRSVSGAGKTTFTELFDPRITIICCADFYFEQDGNYNFDPSKLGLAHAKCREDFDAALVNPDITNIIIANTNVKPSNYAYYVEQGEKIGARITYVVLEKRHNGVNTHLVPPHVLERQANSLKQDIKLI